MIPRITRRVRGVNHLFFDIPEVNIVIFGFGKGFLRGMPVLIIFPFDFSAEWLLLPPVGGLKNEAIS
jgi:hypothetical protein